MRIGRKFKLTEKVFEDVTSAISIGSTIAIAASYAGVALSTLFLWLKIGRESLDKLEIDEKAELTDRETKCCKFYVKVEEAKAYAAIGWLEVVNNAAINNRDPNIALKLLRMRYPGDFDEIHKQEVDITTAGESLGASLESAIKRVYNESD